MIERNMAYGLSAAPKPGAPGHYIITLMALKEKKLEVWMDPDGTLHAVGALNGKPSEFIRVDIESVSGWTGPRVVKVDIYGVSPDGSPAKETIKP